jgi:hypothetical protein
MNQINPPRNSYPYDFEEFDSEDFQTLARHRQFLQLFIGDFHYFEDEQGKRRSFELGREYIEKLDVRDSMRTALQCWYEEKIGMLPHAA